MPDGALDKSRLAAVIFGCLSLLLQLPQVGNPGHPHWWSAASAAAMVLMSAIMVVTYRVKRVLWGDPVAFPVLMAFAGSGLRDVMVTIAIGISILVAQSMYGSLRVVVCRMVGLMVALPATIALSPVGADRILVWHSPDVLGLVPQLGLMCVLVRGLFVATRHQDLAAARNAVLARTGARMLSATNLAQLRVAAGDAGAELSALTPGTVSLVLERRQPGLTVLSSTGLGGQVRDLVFPESSVAGLDATDGESSAAVTHGLEIVTEHAPRIRHWRGVGLAMPESDQFLLVGGERRVPRNIFDTFRNFGQQAALAEAICVRRQREVETRHDQKLESLGRLSAGLAHEINTPIQFVADNTRFLASAYEDMLALLLVYRGFLDLSSSGIPWQERATLIADAENVADLGYLAEEVPVAVEQSREGVERVASLVQAMKAFSFKDSATHAYADLNVALTTTLTVARNEIKYVADVVVELGEVPEVLCSVGDLNQVFLNLLVNAADAMQDRDGQGEIRVRTWCADATAVISIADNGNGIPEEIQETIFEPFFTTKELGKGTGQGLALARGVVDRHHGSIEVKSTVGVGTEFIIRLPVHGNRAPADGPAISSGKYSG